MKIWQKCNWTSENFFYWQTPGWSIAVLMTWCQMSLSLTFLQAVWTPKFKDWRSSSTVLNQVVLGQPTGLLQLACGLSVAAMKRWWSSSGAVRARCPKRCSPSDLTQPDIDEQAVMLRIVSLVVYLVYGICKNVRSSASTRCRKHRGILLVCC